ncbi:hypothetical protein GCM10008908_05870 [Clostridium subterminale]|uniref:DUF6673 domain-containing protein n=1 Tax=Clostridium subterminale TaxID=1550 RepID=A0ABN1KIC6_CLOSU
MNINGIELELDIFDADVAEKYDKAIKKVMNIEEDTKDMSIGEGIRTQCRAIFNVFDELFGEGTYKRIFGDKVNLLECLKAFEALITGINEKDKEIELIANKYSSNRIQRRSKK